MLFRSGDGGLAGRQGGGFFPRVAEDLDGVPDAVEPLLRGAAGRGVGGVDVHVHDAELAEQVEAGALAGGEAEERDVAHGDDHVAASPSPPSLSILVTVAAVSV